MAPMKTPVALIIFIKIAFLWIATTGFSFADQTADDLVAKTFLESHRFVYFVTLDPTSKHIAVTTFKGPVVPRAHKAFKWLEDSLLNDNMKGDSNNPRVGYLLSGMPNEIGATTQSPVTKDGCVKSNRSLKIDALVRVSKLNPL